MIDQQAAADTLAPTRLPESPHALAAAEVLTQLRVTSAEGLCDGAVMARRQRFGPNTITSRRGASVVRLLLHQFVSPVVYLLATAAVLAFYFGELEEGGAIVAVLAINALIGFVTEMKAARSIEALRALGGRTAHVRRDGRVRLVPAEELVPGDIVLLDAGDAVPADLRLVEAASGLAADESTLTGESVAVDKQTQPVVADASLGDRVSMLFKGTFVTRGSGVGVVVATGLATELGRITQLVLDTDSGSSPLERKLAGLSAQLVWATLAVAAAIAAFGLAAGRESFLMVEAAIALAVAAIPEGLPIVATLALARGMWRMARQQRIDRAPVGGRDARRHDRHPDRQDRHPDREPDDGATALPAVGRDRGRSARARESRTLPPRRRPTSGPLAAHLHALQRCASRPRPNKYLLHDRGNIVDNTVNLLLGGVEYWHAGMSRIDRPDECFFQRVDRKPVRKVSEGRGLGMGAFTDETDRVTTRAILYSERLSARYAVFRLRQVNNGDRA